MALLQISEPGEEIEHSKNFSQQGVVVGIDLGTTYSLVAWVQEGKPEVLLDDQGRALLPSIVHYQTNGAVDVGYAAQSYQTTDPQNTIVSVKRLMGKGFSEVAQGKLAVEKLYPYNFADHRGLLSLNTVAGEKTPVEVSAEILRVLKHRAEKVLRQPVVGAVITVPAYFDDAQRQATKDAAHLARLQVLRLLNEPTAAAVAYGLDRQSEGVFAIYDLGGGTFDCSILKLTEGVFQVLATGGDVALGGDDFDSALALWALQQVGLEGEEYPPEDYRALLLEARAAKERLSSQEQAEIRLRLPTHWQSANGKVAQLVLDRSVFTQVTEHLVQKTLGPVRKALRDSGVTLEQINGVVLVGGATRMLHVREAVTRYFQQTPLIDLDPEQIVAFGAALQADLLTTDLVQPAKLLLLDVTPLSLGIETMGGAVERVIQRNSPIPCVQTQEFTTFKNGQTAIAIHVLQGEQELVAECRSLARFELRGIPPLPAGVARIQVTFSVDADGLLTVTAQERSTGVLATVLVKPSYGLTENAIMQTIKNANSLVIEDQFIPEEKPLQPE